MRLLAEEARRSVAMFAERTPLKWTFEVTRGSLPEQLLESAAEAEFIIAALAGSERAALQLAEMCKESGSTSLLWARTRRELEALLREAEMCKESGSSSLLWARTRRELEALLRELRRREE